MHPQQKVRGSNPLGRTTFQVLLPLAVGKQGGLSTRDPPGGRRQVIPPAWRDRTKSDFGMPRGCGRSVGQDRRRYGALTPRRSQFRSLALPDRGYFPKQVQEADQEARAGLVFLIFQIQRQAKFLSDQPVAETRE